MKCNAMRAKRGIPYFAVLYYCTVLYYLYGALNPLSVFPGPSGVVTYSTYIIGALFAHLYVR